MYLNRKVINGQLEVGSRDINLGVINYCFSL